MTDIEFVDRSYVTLVKHNASDDDVAMAAWVSFDRDSEDRLEDRDRVAGLIKFLEFNDHMSPFEHSHFTFKIDTPLFVAREFHRHRTMSYNEVSGRYTEMKPRFYIPGPTRPLIQEGKAGRYTFVEGTPEQYRSMKETLEEASQTAWDHYQNAMQFGVAKEVARMSLPLNLMTQFYATVNARNLMHFLKLRTSEQALYEIREVALAMEKIFQRAMPLTFNAWLSDPRNV